MTVTAIGMLGCSYAVSAPPKPQKVQIRTVAGGGVGAAIVYGQWNKITKCDGYEYKITYTKAVSGKKSKETQTKGKDTPKTNKYMAKNKTAIMVKVRSYKKVNGKKTYSGWVEKSKKIKWPN